MRLGGLLTCTAQLSHLQICSSRAPDTASCRMARANLPAPTPKPAHCSGASTQVPSIHLTNGLALSTRLRSCRLS